MSNCSVDQAIRGWDMFAWEEKNIFTISMGGSDAFRRKKRKSWPPGINEKGSRRQLQWWGTTRKSISRRNKAHKGRTRKGHREKTEKEGNTGDKTAFDGGYGMFAGKRRIRYGTSRLQFDGLAENEDRDKEKPEREETLGEVSISFMKPRQQEDRREVGLC